MKILPYVDLGKAFESLKNSLIEIEKEATEDKETILASGQKYAKAYGRLSAAVEWHIGWNTDTEFGFLRKALESPEKPLSEAASEAPTLLLYEQTHWNESDIPDELFCKPNLHP